MSADNRVVDNEIQRFRVAYEQHQQLEAAVDQEEKIKEVPDRSLFKKAVVMQMVHAFIESGWRLTSQIRQHVTQWLARSLGTLAVEDSYNHIEERPHRRQGEEIVAA